MRKVENFFLNLTLDWNINSTETLVTRSEIAHKIYIKL